MAFTLYVLLSAEAPLFKVGKAKAAAFPKRVRDIERSFGRLENGRSLLFLSESREAVTMLETTTHRIFCARRRTFRSGVGQTEWFDRECLDRVIEEIQRVAAYWQSEGFAAFSRHSVADWLASSGTTPARIRKPCCKRRAGPRLKRPAAACARETAVVPNALIVAGLTLSLNAHRLLLVGIARLQQRGVPRPDVVVTVEDVQRLAGVSSHHTHQQLARACGELVTARCDIAPGITAPLFDAAAYNGRGRVALRFTEDLALLLALGAASHRSHQLSQP